MSSTIVHLTDLEGDWNHLVQNLEALNQEYRKDRERILIVGEGNARFIQIPEDVSIVFGGDLIDKGRYDLDLLHLFNNTKQRTPERLTLIAGNRDLNKLRAPMEINDTHPKALLQAERDLSPEDKNKTGHARLALGLTWVDGGKMTFTDFCSKELSCLPVEALNAFDKINKVGQKILYAKWMLSQTMGAPAAWAFRREYLEELREDCSDEAILRSFMDEFSPTGPVANYLTQALLAEKIGNAGFTHGALNTESYHPILGDEQKHYESFDALVTGLKTWFSEFVTQYYQRVNAPDFGQSVEDQMLLVKKKQVDLMSLPAQAATSTQKATSTVVTNHYMKNGMSLPTEEGFRARLCASKVFIHVSGHQPHANIPGFAALYQEEVEQDLVKGFQAVVTDSCNNRQGKSAALTLVEEMSDGVSYVHRFARDPEARPLVKTTTPGLDQDGYVYDDDGWPYVSDDLRHSPELLVGRKTLTLTDEYFRLAPGQKPSFYTGWEITAYDQDTMMYTLCKVGSPQEGFQIASTNLPSGKVYALIAQMAEGEKKGENEKKRPLDDTSPDEKNILPPVRKSLRYSMLPLPRPSALDVKTPAEDIQSKGISSYKGNC